MKLKKHKWVGTTGQYISGHHLLVGNIRVGFVIYNALRATGSTEKNHYKGKHYYDTKVYYSDNAAELRRKVFRAFTDFIQEFLDE